MVAATDGGGTVRVASALSGRVPSAAAVPSGAVLGATQTRARLTAWLERGRRRLRRTTVTWPTRVRIRGRLTDLRGRPLARTPVRMLERIAGRTWRPITGVRTRRDGRLTTFTRIGPSRAGPARARRSDRDACASPSARRCGCGSGAAER